jgi:hypothetical protein
LMPASWREAGKPRVSASTPKRRTRRPCWAIYWWGWGSFVGGPYLGGFQEDVGAQHIGLGELERVAERVVCPPVPCVSQGDEYM